jgi:hypothetical protein
MIIVVYSRKGGASDRMSDVCLGAYCMIMTLLLFTDKPLTFESFVGLLALSAAGSRFLFFRKKVA